MKEKNELILSTGSVWKISSDTWPNWLIESKQSKIDFYGCSPFYSPFTYQTDNEYRITILEKWKQIFKQKNIEIFSYTPEMRNYPLNLADTNEEIRCDSVSYCSNAIVDAAILDAQFVRIRTGYSYLHQNPDLAFSQLCRSMESILPLAQKHNITLLTGPDDYDVTNIIFNCKSVIKLTEKFPENNLSIILPAHIIGENAEPSNWYINTLGKRIAALELSTDYSNLISELQKIESDPKLSSQLPIILELSGANNIDTHLESVKKGIFTAGTYNNFPLQNMEVNTDL